MSSFIYARRIPGIEPAIGVDHAFRGFIILPVAHHHVRASDHQRILVAEFDLNVGHRLADAGGKIVGRTVGAGDGTRFGQAITLENRQAERNEHSRNLRRKRRAAG